MITMAVVLLAISSPADSQILGICFNDSDCRNGLICRNSGCRKKCDTVGENAWANKCGPNAVCVEVQGDHRRCGCPYGYHSSHPDDGCSELCPERKEIRETPYSHMPANFFVESGKCAPQLPSAHKPTQRP